MGQSSVYHVWRRTFCMIFCSAALLFQSACALELPQVVTPATPPSNAIVKKMPDKAPPLTKTPAPVKPLVSIEKDRAVSMPVGMQEVQTKGIISGGKKLNAFNNTK
jgi:hypothetical protein